MLTKEQIDRYIELAEEGKTKIEICHELGVTVHEVDDTRRTDEDFRRELRKRRSHPPLSGKMSAEMRNEILRLLKYGRNQAEVAREMNINAETIYDQRASFPEFDEAFRNMVYDLEPDVKKAYLDSLRCGSRRYVAARKLNIASTHISNCIRTNPEFKQQVEEAEEEACEVVEDALWRNAVDGNFNAQKFWLVNRASHRWSEKKQLPGSIDSVIPIQVNVSNVFDDIQRLAVEYEKQFNDARKLTSGESRELATAAILSQRGRDKGPRMVGNCDLTKDSVGE